VKMATNFDEQRKMDAILMGAAADREPAARIPPHDIDAEKAVLGAMLLDKHAVPVAIELLQPDYFYSTANEKIFATMVELYSKNTEIDVITVREELKKKGIWIYRWFTLFE
jgi:Replicative DNA helicase